MRGFLLRSAAVIIMVAILGGHLTELFDHWDHTLRTGQDSDYLVVLIAGCAGAAFVIAKASRFVRRLHNLVTESVPRMLPPAESVPAFLQTFAFDLSPPATLAPIRI
jgi:hypothetical protein